MHLYEFDYSTVQSKPVSQRQLLTKRGHSSACFIKQQEGNHEERVWGTQHRLECYKLLEGDQAGGEKNTETRADDYNAVIRADSLLRYLRFRSPV